jgi:tetratricopeptide (TPR) repeat protein
MNKLQCLALICLCFILPSCYKSPNANTTQTSRTPEQTSPTAEKSVQPTAQISPTKNGNYQQALNDYNSKNFDKAETGFKEVLTGEPNNADAHFYLGNIYYNRKDYETSLPHFEQAAKIDYKSVEKLMALGDNQRILKKYDVAIVQYFKVTGFEPNNANAYYGAGMTYIGLNNKIAARQQLQQLQPLNKDLAAKLSKEIDGLK